MAFQVDITEPALIDADDYLRFVRDSRKEPDAANIGFAVSCAPFILYFSHRIIYRVKHDQNRVLIYRIYHGSRRSLL